MLRAALHGRVAMVRKARVVVRDLLFIGLGAVGGRHSSSLRGHSKEQVEVGKADQ